MPTWHTCPSQQTSKPRESIIFWTIWCALLPQHSILHDLFTWKNSRRAKNCGTHCILECHLVVLLNTFYLEFVPWHALLAIYPLLDNISSECIAWENEAECWLPPCPSHCQGAPRGTEGHRTSSWLIRPNKCWSPDMQFAAPLICYPKPELHMYNTWRKVLQQCVILLGLTSSILPGFSYPYFRDGG